MKEVDNPTTGSALNTPYFPAFLPPKPKKKEEGKGGEGEGGEGEGEGILDVE